MNIGSIGGWVRGTRRDALEAALDPANDVADCGPYARETSALLVENAVPPDAGRLAADRLGHRARRAAGTRPVEPRPGDGSVLDAYADATGVTPLPAMLKLFRIRWDIADIAVGVSRFRRPHEGSLDDDKTWDVLRTLIDHIAAR